MAKNRRRIYEDDEEQEPRQRTKRGSREERGGGRKTQKKRSARWLFLSLVFGGFLLAGGTAATVWILDARKGPDGAGVPDSRDQILRYLPDGLRHIRYVAVAKLLADPEYQKIRPFFQAPDKPGAVIDPLPETYAIPISDIERIVQGAGEKGKTVALTLTKPATAAAIRQKNTPTGIAATWSEEKVNGQTLHVISHNWQINVKGASTTNLGSSNCFFMPDNKTVVFGVASHLRLIMERKGGPRLGPGLEKVLPQVDFRKLLVNVTDGTNADVPIYDDKPFSIDIRIFLLQRVLTAKVVYTELGADIANTITYVCKDPEGLKYLKERLESGIQRGIEKGGVEAAELFKNHTFTVEGNSLILRLPQSQPAIAAWLKSHPRQTLILAD